ncbi:MAG: glycosyltransferase family 39 protein [Verrucomicrobia bacterium]|nr:glycosyltransferase family 39 protein [Verrucomicrobiota bacterium]
MIGALALLIALVVPAGIGVGLLRLLVPPLMRRDPIEQVFIGGFFGLFLITAQICVYALLGVGRSFWSLILPWALFLTPLGRMAYSMCRTRLHRSKGRSRKVHASERTRQVPAWPRLNVVDIVLLVLLTGELFWLVTATVNEPVWGWDTMVNWASKAKIFYMERRPELSPMVHNSYPLGVPLAMTWVYHCLGAWNDAVGKGIFILPFAFGGLGFYAVLRSLTHRTWALAATAALLATPRLFLNLVEGYADSFLTLLYGPAVLLLCRWVRDDRHWDLLAAALCLGMTAWIKAEGLPLNLIALVLAVGVRLVSRRPWTRPDVISLGLALVLVVFAGLTWQIVAWSLKLDPLHGKDVYSMTGFVTQLTGERLHAIAKHLWQEARQLRFWGVLWFVWPVAAVAAARRLARPVPAMLGLAILGDLALIFVIFITTGLSLEWHLSAALERLMINLLPLLVAFTTVQAYALFEGKERLSPAPDPAQTR